MRTMNLRMLTVAALVAGTGLGMTGTGAAAPAETITYLFDVQFATVPTDTTTR